MTRQVYISDTNIWIDFGKAGLLEALFDLPFEFCSTDFVVNELTEEDRLALDRLGLQVLTLSPAQMDALVPLMAQHNNSSAADVSCYLMARTIRCPLLTGDRRLRAQADRDRIEVHGALWLLDQLVAYATLHPSQAAAGLERMLERGARFPENECQQRLREWRK